MTSEAEEVLRQEMRFLEAAGRALLLVHAIREVLAENKRLGAELDAEVVEATYDKERIAGLEAENERLRARIDAAQSAWDRWIDEAKVEGTEHEPHAKAIAEALRGGDDAE